MCSLRGYTMWLAQFHLLFPRCTRWVSGSSIIFRSSRILWKNNVWHRVFSHQEVLTPSVLHYVIGWQQLQAGAPISFPKNDHTTFVVQVFTGVYICVHCVFIHAFLCQQTYIYNAPCLCLYLCVFCISLCLCNSARSRH